MTGVYARSLHVLGLVVLATLGAVSSQDDGDRRIVTPGDVMIAAIVEVNDMSEGQCGAYSKNSLQVTLALTWFVDALNEMNYVDGIKLGLEIHRTCGLPERAAQAVVELVKTYSVETAAPLLGIVGPGRTSEAMAASSLISSLPSEQHVLQIVDSATGRQLSDKDRFPNLLRVIPPDDIQIQVMLKLMLEMKWNYVAIVYDDDDYGLSSATQLRRLAEENHICVTLFAEMALDSASEKYATDTVKIMEQITSKLIRGMVVIGGSRTTSKLLKKLDEDAKFVQLILSEAVELHTASFTQTVARGSLITSPPYVSLPEFLPFWNALWTNKTRFDAVSARLPWLKSYVEEVAGCRDCWNLVRENLRIPAGESEARVSLFVGYAAKAAAVLAEVLRGLKEEKCPGAAWTSAACAALKESIRGHVDVLNAAKTSSFNFDRLANVSQALASLTNARFDDEGEVSDSSTRDAQYDVYNLQGAVPEDPSFRQVGSFSSGQLNVNKSQVTFYDEGSTPLTWDLLRPAQCDVNHNCEECEPDVSKSVAFVPGDFYVVAILPVHAKNPHDHLQPGDIKGVVGADMAQAVLFSVDRLNEKQGQFQYILPGRKIGLVGISSMGSELLVRQSLMDFFAGRLMLPDGRNSSVLLDKFVGIIGTFYSSNSIAAAETLNAMDRTFVQISPASTNPDLKCRAKYPYFMRLVMADDQQAKALLDVALKLDARYIQVIYDRTAAYSTGMLEQLQKALRATNGNYSEMCIAQSIGITPHNDTNRYKYIFDEMMNNSSAKVVLVILHAEEITKVMDAILPKLTDDFMFVASESWGRRQEILNGRTRLRGSLVLSQEIAPDSLFAANFSALDPSASSARNPWLRLFWETRLNCYFPNSFKKLGTKEKRRKPCPGDLAGSHYVPDTRVPFHIQSVYALVKGFHRALTAHCGPEARSTCSDLTSSRLVSAVKRVQLDLYGTGQEVPVFDENGDGRVGFKILRIDRTAFGNNVTYNEIGEWTKGYFFLNKSDGKLVSSKCPHEKECARCKTAWMTTKREEYDHCSAAQETTTRCDLETVTSTPSRQFVDDENGSVIVVAAVLGAFLAIMVVIFVAVIVCLVRRQKSLSDAVKKERGRFSQEEERQTMPLPSVPAVADPPPCHKRPESDYLTPVDDTITTTGYSTCSDVSC